MKIGDKYTIKNLNHLYNGCKCVVRVIQGGSIYVMLLEGEYKGRDLLVYEEELED